MKKTKKLEGVKTSLFSENLDLETRRYLGGRDGRTFKNSFTLVNYGCGEPPSVLSFKDQEPDFWNKYMG